MDVNRLERIWVIGCSGSGKSTLTRTLAERLDLPRHELDALFHRPDWQQTPDDEFRRLVDEIIADERWLLDGNYFTRTQGAIADRVQTVVWLDLPRALTMRRVIARTFRRVLTREELWNGNREPWSNLYSPDPHKNIIVWSFTQHPVYRQRYAEAIATGEFGNADVVRLTSGPDVERWLAGVT